MVENFECSERNLHSPGHELHSFSWRSSCRARPHRIGATWKQNKVVWLEITLRLYLGQRMEGADKAEQDVRDSCSSCSQNRPGHVHVQVLKTLGGRQFSFPGHLYWLFSEIFCFVAISLNRLENSHQYGEQGSVWLTFFLGIWLWRQELSRHSGLTSQLAALRLEEESVSMVQNRKSQWELTRQVDFLPLNCLFQPIKLSPTFQKDWDFAVMWDPPHQQRLQTKIDNTHGINRKSMLFKWQDSWHLRF